MCVTRVSDMIDRRISLFLLTSVHLTRLTFMFPRVDPCSGRCWGGRLPFPSFPSLTNPRWSCLAVRDTPWFLDLQIPDLGLGPRVVQPGLGVLRGFGYARIASAGVCGKMLERCGLVRPTLVTLRGVGFRHAS